MSNTRKAKPQRTTPTSTRVHTIKVVLRGSSPSIWRRLQVPSRATLLQLHGIIQRAFGWEGGHGWVFETGRGRYGLEERELEQRSAASMRLGNAAPRARGRMQYTYDFGDGWEHDIQVEAIGEADVGVSYPRCIDGHRAGPPDDCGGIWGYQELIEILGDPQHEEHDDWLDWMGLETADDFDPAAFDMPAVNRALADHATVLREH